MLDISKDKFREMLWKMLLTRKFEEKVDYFFAEGIAHGTTHLYIGEEAVAAGVCCALEKQDIIFSTHRGHGHCISKGMDVKTMMAEMFGRETGCCKGKGGSMHFADIETGNYGANGVVGGGQPLAVGAALATKIKKEDRIVVCFFGDGASNEGTFHESLNLASVWNLPVLFVCEDNKYGMSVSKSQSMNIEDISVRATAYGIRGIEVDGMDAVKVYSTACEARKYVSENGPMLMVCDTYRYMGHSKSDANVYRTQEEVDEWKKRDAIDILKKIMLEEEAFSVAEIKAMEKSAEQEIEAAVEYAKCSGYPEIDDIGNDVYA